MFRPLILFGLLAFASFAADESWTKLSQLTSGTEIRVYKRGATQPVTAKLDEATDDRLLIVVKNEQVAIPKEEIDRVDYRPSKGGGRVTREIKTTRDADVRPADPATRPGSTTTSSSTSISMGKPDFETIYRRRAAAPKQ